MRRTKSSEEQEEEVEEDVESDYARRLSRNVPTPTPTPTRSRAKKRQILSSSVEGPRGGVKDLPPKLASEEEEDVTPHKVSPSPPFIPPLPIPPADPPPFVDPPPPTIIPRSEIVLLIQALPSMSSEKDLLHLRSLLKQRGFDDTAPAILLIQKAFSSRHGAIGVRLFKECISTLLKKGASEGTAIRVVEEVIGSAIKKKRWHEVVSVSNTALNLGAISQLVLSRRFRALCALGRDKEILKGFNLWSLYEIKMKGQDWDEIISAHLRSGDLASAQEKLRLKTESGFGTTPQTIFGLLGGMVDFGGNLEMEQRVLSGVEDGVERLRRGTGNRQNSRVLNRIMSVRALREEVDLALEVVEFFDWAEVKGGLPPLTKQSTTATTTSLNIINESSPTFISIPPWCWKPRPDIATFTILSGIALRVQRPSSAILLFLKSQQFGVGVNEHLVTAFIKAVVAIGGIEAAEEMVSNLKAGTATVHGSGIVLDRFEPTNLVYEVLLVEILKVRGLTGASNLFERIVRDKEVNVQVTGGMVDSLIAYVSSQKGNGVLGKENSLIGTRVILDVAELTNKKRRATIAQFNTILESAALRERFNGTIGAKRRRQFQRRKSLIPPLSSPPPPSSTSITTTPEMIRVQASLNDRSIRHTRSTTQHILRNVPTSQDVNKLWQYLETDLLEKGIKPTRQIITVIMRAQRQQGDLEGVKRSIERAVEMGLERHVSFYSVLLGGAARWGNKAIVDWAEKEVVERGLELDRSFFYALALSKVRRRDINGVKQVLAQARTEYGISVRAISTTTATESRFATITDPISLTILYRCYVSLPRFLPLLRAQILVRRSLKLGLVPDFPTLCVLERTRRWLRWKSNRGKRTKWGTRFLVWKAKRANLLALKEIRKRMRMPQPRLQRLELAKLEILWANYLKRKKKALAIAAKRGHLNRARRRELELLAEED